MKRIFSLLLIALLLLVPALTAFAEGDTATSDGIALTAGGKPTVVDEAHILSGDEAAALSKRLKKIGDTYKCDVIAVIVLDLDGKTAADYAEYFFEYRGYGYGAVPDENGKTTDGDGVLLLLSMAERDYYVATCGYAITAFTDYGIQTFLEPMFLPYFRNDDYAGGFNAFADGCDSLLRQAREGKPYDVEHPFPWITLLLAIAAGGLIALIPVSAMKRQLTDVGKQTNADRYLEPQTFALTQNSDVLLGTNIARTVHVVQTGSGGRSGGSGGFHGGSTTHTSSGGSTFGGHGGKF